VPRRGLRPGRGAPSRSPRRKFAGFLSETLKGLFADASLSGATIQVNDMVRRLHGETVSIEQVLSDNVRPLAQAVRS
jgi:lipid-binding SYLF domain-containing protein